MTKKAITTLFTLQLLFTGIPAAHADVLTFVKDVVTLGNSREQRKQDRIAAQKRKEAREREETRKRELRQKLNGEIKLKNMEIKVLESSVARRKDSILARQDEFAKLTTSAWLLDSLLDSERLSRVIISLWQRERENSDITVKYFVQNSYKQIAPLEEEAFQELQQSLEKLEVAFEKKSDLREFEALLDKCQSLSCQWELWNFKMLYQERLASMPLEMASLQAKNNEETRYIQFIKQENKVLKNKLNELRRKNEVVNYGDIPFNPYCRVCR